MKPTPVSSPSTERAILRITALGGLSIQLNDQPVSGFISRKVGALLLYLVANPREHPRELLAELLWDDVPPDRGLSYLRTALANLQRQLAPFLRVTRQTIGVNPEADIWLDSKVLEDALDMAESDWQQNGRLSGQVLYALEDRLPLYRGPFLEGFNLRDALSFEGWMIVEQERLRNRMILTLQRMAEAALARGEYKQGIAQIMRLLQIDPLHEEGYRLHMRMLVGSGQRSTALAQYETCVRILDTELVPQQDENDG